MMSTTEESDPTVQHGNVNDPSFADETGMTNISIAGDGSDIPLDDDDGPLPPHKQLSVRSGVASLPSVEQVSNDPEHARHTGWSKKKIWLLSGGIIVLLAIIIGVSVGVTTKNKSAASGSSSEEAQRARLVEVANFLVNEGISYEEAVTTPGSPQNRAASFMAIDDEAQLEVPKSRGLSEAYQFIERYALATYYYAFSGDQWDFKMNFLTPDNTCLWYETLRTTTGQRNNFGAQCNDKGKVSIILMPWNNMVGSMPQEIGLLTDLVFFAIPSNRNLFGSIPENFKKLTNLEFLHMAKNAFDGPVPEWIGDLSKLSSLALSDNAFQGSIPSSMSKMTELRFLSMDGNALNGQMDALEGLTNLQYLYLEKNMFEQGLGSDTFRELKKLEQLDLSDNMLTGKVPRHLLHMKEMDVLDLSDNLLTGRLPETIPENTLKFLFLHGNQLEGEIPTSLLNITGLNHLDLSQNNFTGPMPTFLGNLTDLVYLFLSENDFDKGPLPESLTNLPLLRDLSLKKTQRSGTIPTWIGQLQSLLLLDLDRNELTGPIPSEIGQLTYLGLLLLNRNQLSGTIPPQISNMGNLAMLLLDNNTITGTTTDACNLKQLQVFISDCGGDNPEVDCPGDCCFECCDDAGPACNDENLLAQFDPIWESSYQRRDYTFADDLWFVPVASTPP